MRLVVDASVIIQLSLAGGALGPLDGHELIAPPILASEVTSTLAEMTFRGEVQHDDARRAVADLASLPIRYDRPDGLYVRSWDLARQLGWAKSYDAEYLALALIADAQLITLDERMRRGGGHLVDMPLVTDLRPA